MGLIKEVLLLPAAPVRFSVWVASKVAEQAEQEHFSTGAGIRRVREIEREREEGRVGEEEAAELEGRVLEEQLGTAQNPEGTPGTLPGPSST